MSAPQRKHKASSRSIPAYAKPSQEQRKVAENIRKMEQTCWMNAFRVVPHEHQVSYDRVFLKQLVRAIKKAEAQNKHPATDSDVCRLKLDPRYMDLIRGGNIYQADRDDRMTVVEAIVQRN